ncbi:ROK family transcriptional regulator [Arthrobacter silviterrae]|uniref:ROK family transcriptional regulator n=1 Tax=Arthrobacter silviterrae TaxID=2026658 RepID=A0ABX0DCA3_9MICC|nr:ROK family transcriptional regulator [Arthrobacter silviterrae]NGN84553.1 ROK family transcriptional regulator [Arthrobacter silviterrae]
MGDFNQAVVLDAIRRSQDGISRTELVQTSGLSTQTVSNIVRRLLKQGIVSEGEKTVTGIGKPRTPLVVVPNSRFAIGVHLDPSVITVVALDLTGSVAFRSREQTGLGVDAATMVARIAEIIEQWVASVRIPPERLLGIGIAVPGPIDEAMGTIVSPPLLQGWDAIRVREALRDAVGLPVLMEKDVIAAAHGEQWSRDNDDENFAFIYLGTGIGAGLVVDGQVLRGASNNVGGIGHFATGSTTPLCSCGRSGCVGAATQPANLVAWAIERGVLPPLINGADSGEVIEAFVELGRLADKGDPGARDIVDTSARQLAVAVENVASLIDVDTVILGGPMWHPVSRRYLGILGPELAARYEVRAIHGIDVTSSVLGEDIAAIGAGCAILDHMLAPKQTGLLLQD